MIIVLPVFKHCKISHFYYILTSINGFSVKEIFIVLLMYFTMNVLKRLFFFADVAKFA